MVHIFGHIFLSKDGPIIYQLYHFIREKIIFLICFKTAKLVFFFNFRSIFLCCEFSRILYSMKPDREIFNYRHAFLWLWQGFSTKHYATTCKLRSFRAVLVRPDLGALETLCHVNFFTRYCLVGTVKFSSISKTTCRRLSR